MLYTAAWILLRLAWWVIPKWSLRNLTSATVRAERPIRPLPVMTSKSVILLLRLHNVAHTVYLCGQSVHGSRMPAVLMDELALRSGSKHGSWGYDSLFSEARSFRLRFAKFWSRGRPKTEFVGALGTRYTWYPTIIKSSVTSMKGISLLSEIVEQRWSSIAKNSELNI